MITRNRTLLLGTSLYKPYCSEVHLLINTICILGSQCGQSQGLLYKQARHELINPLIQLVSLFLQQLYGAATPKRLEIGVPVIK